jgi:polyribonucleotide 5'-hydroxyl-kinase
VLGSERLYSDISKRFVTSSMSPDELVHVIRLSKSGGCVDRDESCMKQLRQAQIRSYFFGGPKSALSPVTMGVDFDGIKVMKFTERMYLVLHDKTSFLRYWKC